ncbi:Rne/Rng family ribonuclease [Jatrophihabitans sp. DSM 45814]
MLDNEPDNNPELNSPTAPVLDGVPDATAPSKRAPRKAAAKRAPRAATKAVKAVKAAKATVAKAGNSEGVTIASEAPATEPAKKATRARKAAPKKAAAPAMATADGDAAGAQLAGAPTAGEPEPPAKAAKKATRKRATKATASVANSTDQPPSADGSAYGPPADIAESQPAGQAAAASGPVLAAPSVLFQPPSESTPAPSRRRGGSKSAAKSIDASLLPLASESTSSAGESTEPSDAEPAGSRPTRTRGRTSTTSGRKDERSTSGSRRSSQSGQTIPGEGTDDGVRPDDQGEDLPAAEALTAGELPDEGEDATESGSGRRRRRRGRRGRGSRTGDAHDAQTNDTDAGNLPDGSTDEDDGARASDDDADDSEIDVVEEADHAEEVAEAALSASARRRRRRRRSSGGDDASGADATADDDPPNTVVHVRDSRSDSRPAGGGRGNEADSDGVRGVKGSTRLEAKRQRRRDNRDSGRRRAPILTEAEFLARREAVDRVMAVRQTGDRTQIAVLEDNILVEHYVTRATATSAVGNVYLGRVQNVLPSMEAAFVDIGRGRNGVLYAGEVNWDAAGLEGKSRAIENALSSGDMVLVQVTKDPIGHKGARLTSQISLPGRFVVYIPGGGMTGISRKLPDVERTRLKAILKKVVPDDAGVIVRTAAEGASEDDLVSDVERLKAQWDAISVKSAKTSDSPSLVYGEPDLAIRVVRDVFNDDFKQLRVAGADIYATITDYVSDVAPELANRISLHTAESDLFHDLRVDEQLTKALDRKVYLPSGGSLVIDRTEAMVVIDVNTGKYTGSGGNLEQTVTRNNLEAAEEIVRQLRLRDIGGIVVIDFIDMVLESNRELVLRRLTECLGRDRTKHQVAEVTSLGLVQMTRKRVGEGLLEAFSEPCEHCKGRGVIVHTDPVERKFGGPVQSTAADEDRPTRGKRGRKSKASVNEGTDAAALVVDADKRRAAASAIAAIAAATNHHDEVGGGSDTDADTDAGSLADVATDDVGGGAVEYANSGSAAAEVADSAWASTQASTSPLSEARPVELTPETHDEPISGAMRVAESARMGRSSTRTDSDPGADWDAAARPGWSSEPVGSPASPAADNGSAPAARPRRRRAASRPAGPPAAVSSSVPAGSDTSAR